MDVSQWEFYATPTYILDERKRSQYSITLSSLRKLVGQSVAFEDLRSAVRVAGTDQESWE